jgi:sensor c-di-GMP phosphodiesterase-like protein
MILSLLFLRKRLVLKYTQKTQKGQKRLPWTKSDQKSWPKREKNQKCQKAPQKELVKLLMLQSYVRQSVFALSDQSASVDWFTSLHGYDKTSREYKRIKGTINHPIIIHNASIEPLLHLGLHAIRNIA